MTTRTWTIIAALMTALGLALLMSACFNPNPQPLGLTPVPTLAPAATLTLAPALQGAASAAAAGTPAAPGKGDAALGVPIYEQHCASCHGIQGEGGIGPALRNNQNIQAGDDQAVFTTIANGRPGTQ